jgi:hypothetical protein
MIEDAGSSSFSCSTCADGYKETKKFKGPKDVPVYKCEVCEGVGMEYETTTQKAGQNYKCVCGTQSYDPAGDICILRENNPLTSL